MKRMFLLFLIGVVISGSALFFIQRISHQRQLEIQSIGQQGIFVGDKKFAPTFDQSPELQARHLREQEEHQKSLRAIDEAAEYVRVGDRHAKVGNFQEAAVAYKKSYSIGGGSMAVSGLLLAMTYEKLGQYDDGIALVDEMIKKGYLSDQGIKNANEIRARLLAAKNRLS